MLKKLARKQNETLLVSLSNGSSYLLCKHSKDDVTGRVRIGVVVVAVVCVKVVVLKPTRNGRG